MLVKNNNRLKELRLNHGYTLDDIESRTGIKRGTYSNYENHNTEPKLETWKKLASFFDVSVPYLQGLEPNFFELTPKTKKMIILKLNTFYFDADANKLMSHHNKVPIDRVRSAVNEYAEHAKIVPLLNKVALGTDKQKNKFLNEYFSYLFQEKYLVGCFNRYIYFESDKNQHHVTDAQLANWLARSIRDHTIQEFQTELGFYIEENINLKDTFEAFQRSLNFCKNVGDVKKQFEKFISFLNQTQSSLNKINSIDLANFTHKAQLEQKIFRMILDLMRTDIGYRMAIKKCDKKYPKDFYGETLFFKEYLSQNNLEIPKEVKEYIEKYSIDDK